MTKNYNIYQTVAQTDTREHKKRLFTNQMHSFLINNRIGFKINEVARNASVRTFSRVVMYT